MCNTSGVKLGGRDWALVLVVAAVLAASVTGGVLWTRYSRVPTTAGMLKRLPTRDALIFWIDLDRLRHSGLGPLLQGANTAEDPEYQSFARKIDFDYRRDLDSVLLTVTPDGKYMLVSGRFDWKSLRAYAASEGGGCDRAGVCRVTGSTPERRISFEPAQPRLMALAVSPDQSAVLRITDPRPGPDPEVPNAPVWLKLPSSMLRTGEGLPMGTRMFARGMDNAESVVLSFVPEGGRLAAHLEVSCRDEEDAVQIASQLSSTTVTLKRMLDREHQAPGPADLAGILASGSFRSEGAKVFGYWRIEPAFLEKLLGA